MGNSEEEKPSKTEALSSPAVDQNNVPVYHDWAAVQAYYGSRLSVPPYHNSVISSNVPPPYMWGPPQSMIPPYGVPYAAFYAHGGVYAHPGVHLAGTALSMDTPVKSSGNTDGGLVKKLKELDGLAISIGKGNRAYRNHDSAEDAVDHGVTQSEETEDTSDGSVGSSGTKDVTGQSGTKRRHQRSPNSAENGKGQKQSRSIPGASTCHGSEVVADVIPSANIPAEKTETMKTALELKDPSDFNVKSCPINALQTLKPSEAWLQNDQELKRERRKQSNRESARRSRLRKQADYEELTIKVQALTSENMTLKSEINKLMNNSKKLKLDTATLMEKLKDAQTDEASLHMINDFSHKPDGTVNLLARVNNNCDANDRRDDEGERYENTSPGAKLHQLLDASTRTDAVAAS